MEEENGTTQRNVKTVERKEIEIRFNTCKKAKRAAANRVCMQNGKSGRKWLVAMFPTRREGHDYDDDDDDDEYRTYWK